MDPLSHFQLVSRHAFQLMSYVFQQLPSSYECSLDSTKFFEALSIVIDDADDTDDLNMAEPDHVDNEHPSTIRKGRKRVTPRPWGYAPNVLPHQDANKTNQAQHRRWLTHLEVRSQYIPAMRNTDFQAERVEIQSGQVATRASKSQVANRK